MPSWCHIICFVGRSRLAFRLGTWSKVEKGPETLAMAKRAMPSDVPRGPLGGAPTEDIGEKYWKDLPDGVARGSTRCPSTPDSDDEEAMATQ